MGNDIIKFVGVNCFQVEVVCNMDMVWGVVPTMSASARIRVAPGACFITILSWWRAATNHNSLEHAAKIGSRVRPELRVYIATMLSVVMRSSVALSSCGMSVLTASTMFRASSWLIWYWSEISRGNFML